MAVGMLAALGAACESAAGRKVSNRVREVINRWGEDSPRSAGVSGASSGARSGCATPSTPGKWDSPASTKEVLEQALSHLQRNSEMFVRGDSPEPGDLHAYRTLDPSRGGSLTNDDDIVTAGEGQAPCANSRAITTPAVPHTGAASAIQEPLLRVHRRQAERAGILERRVGRAPLPKSVK